MSAANTSPFPAVKTWEFWRNQAVYFCLFSLVGHWMEIPYCMFIDGLFGIVDDNSLVWADPMLPFPVYGFGVVICALVMVPLKRWLSMRCGNDKRAAFEFFIAGVLVAMAMELTQGFIQNMPDENGVYPLWDNSQLPFNILGQAWLVNDVFLSMVITLYVWLIYPALEYGIAKLPPRFANVATVVIVIAFAILLVVKNTAV